jgi:hypothetical protein
MQRQLKTKTLCDLHGNPTLITCRGHVSFPVFNKAMLREWQADPIPKESRDQMRYEYYIPHPKKAWKRVDGQTKGARKYTVMAWD